MTKVGIAGHKGRVGQLLAHELQHGDKWSPLTLGGGSEKGIDLIQALGDSGVIIDFTTPESTMAHLELALGQGIPVVIGTTGLSKEQEEKISEASKSIAIVYAANTSVGVNLIAALIKQASAILGAAEFDIEINETHHRYKVDAPSGTAIMLGQAAASGRGVKLDDVKTDVRSGHTGARTEGDIGFSVQRGGLVPGTHHVTFYGNEESVTISHTAHDRKLFAKGALEAALWVIKQKPGLYSMHNVLGL